MRAVKQNLEIDLDNYSQKYVNRLSTGCIVRKVFGFDWNATLCEGSVGAVGSQYVKTVPVAPQPFAANYAKAESPEFAIVAS